MYAEIGVLSLSLSLSKSELIAALAAGAVIARERSRTITRRTEPTSENGKRRDLYISKQRPPLNPLNIFVNFPTGSV